jgi:hypothetical protein
MIAPSRSALVSSAILALASCTPSRDTAPSAEGPLDAAIDGTADGASPPDSGNRDADDAAADGARTAASDGGDAETDAPGDRATGDAAADGGAEAGSSCAGLFCEDFEKGEIDASKWNMQMAGGATVTIQRQIVAHGQFAAQFHSLGKPAGGAGQAYVYLIASSVAGALGVHNFGRAYFYTSPKPTSNNLGLVWGGTSGFPTPTYMSLASHGSGWQFGFIKLQGSPQGEVQTYATDPVPVATWLCLEWEFDDQPDTVHVWGDGQAIGTLDADDVDYPPGHAAGTLYDGMTSGLIGAFTDFGFGFYDWHPGNYAFDVYYDDIVLDTKRVGCL